MFSFGTAGCNLTCKFCQNYDISKAREIDRLNQDATPVMIADAARQLGCRSVAFTYNDPVIFLEYAVDTARACHEAGLKTVAVTAGYITPAARGEFYADIDAANVDLKGFTEPFYRNLCGGRLADVLDTLVWIRSHTNVWLEVTTLLIPGENDSDAEIGALSAWFAAELGRDVPLHFTAFHPDWRMRDHPPTPPATLTRARAIAMGHGLRYVYTGNVHDGAGGSTYCHGCGAMLIGRDWYRADRVGVGCTRVLSFVRYRGGGCVRGTARQLGTEAAAGAISVVGEPCVQPRPGRWRLGRRPVSARFRPRQVWSLPRQPDTGIRAKVGPRARHPASARLRTKNVPGDGAADRTPCPHRPSTRMGTNAASDCPRMRIFTSVCRGSRRIFS